LLCPDWKEKIYTRLERRREKLEKKLKEVYIPKIKECEKRMKHFKSVFCIFLIFLLSTAFLFADEKIRIEDKRMEFLEPSVKTGITAKKFPIKHFSAEVIENGPILGGFDRRDAPWSANILASDGWGQDDPDQHTSMAIGPDGAVYVAYAAMYQGGTDWDFGIARSADNGQSWSSNALGTASDERNPDIAVDGEGYVWIFCTLDDGSQGKRAFTRSDIPNSIGFSSIYSFAGVAGDYYIDPSAWAFGGEGSADLHVFVAWSYDDGANDDQMHIMYNDPVGQWSTWTMGSFPEDGDTDMNPDVAISTNNVIMANIEDVSGADQELRIWYLDIGSVWTGGGWGIWEYTIAGDDAYPSIFATGTNVFVTFQNDAGAGNWDVIHGNSADDGGTWDIGAYVANTANAERYPRVSGLSDITGVVYLEGSNVRFRQSGSLGQAGTWEPDISLDPERVTDQDAADESVRSASVFHTGVAWVATWVDDRNFGSKGLDIWSSYRDVGVSQISTNPPTPDSFIYFDYTSGKGFGTLSYITKYCERVYNPVLSEGVLEKIQKAHDNDLIGVLITMRKQVSTDYLLAMAAPMKRREARDFVWKELRKYADGTQEGLLEYLNQKKSDGKATRISSIFTGNRIGVRATKDVISEISKRSDVGWITPEVPVSLLNDTRMGTASGNMEPRSVEANLVSINADAVWASGYTGAGVIVGQLDTGANHAHNDLNDHLWSGAGYPNGGYDFENGDTDPSDDNGHGSLTAGFICGDGTNSDTTGVAPDATIMILRTSTNVDMHNAVDFALSGGSGAGSPADVLQSSVGFERGQFGTSAAWETMKNEFRVDAIDVLAAGNCWTYAAGNGNSFVGGHYNAPDDIIVAANCPPPWLHPDQTLVGGKTAVIAAGATNNARSRTAWSSFGPAEWDNSSYADYPYAQPFNMGLLRPDIMVPGSNLTSLARIGQGYSSGNSGTSFSAPQLAGAVALMLSKDGSLTPARIDSILENTTRPVISSDPPGKDSLNGSGFLDIEAACLGIGNAKKAILWVKNDPTATGYLIVTNITHKQPWVLKVEPTSFSVAPDDSQAVDVWADTTGFGLPDGISYDTLFIVSNSQSKTTTAVEVRLEKGILKISMTSLTATAYVGKIALNWRTASEYNVEAWQIVRSEVADGDYTMIGMLPGNGTTSQPHSYSFTDSDVVGGRRYYYKLISIDNMGTTAYGPVSAVAKAGPVISSLALSSNPAKNVGIRFNLSKNALVSLKIYDITGRLVKTLVNGMMNPDAYNIVWNGSNNNGKHTGCGVYFIKMDAAGEKSTLKVTLLK